MSPPFNAVGAFLCANIQPFGDKLKHLNSQPFMNVRLRRNHPSGIYFKPSLTGQRGSGEQDGLLGSLSTQSTGETHGYHEAGTIQDAVMGELYAGQATANQRKRQLPTQKAIPQKRSGLGEADSAPLMGCRLPDPVTSCSHHPKPRQVAGHGGQMFGAANPDSFAAP